MGKFTYWWNILGTIQIWVNLPSPQIINLPSSRMNVVWVNLPSVKSELSWVNLPTAGTFWGQFRFGYIYLTPDDKFTINWNEFDMGKFSQCQVCIIIGKFTSWWNILGTIQIWVNLPSPQKINLPAT